jgi:hypothetical protein
VFPFDGPGSGGDNSTVTICKTWMDQQQVLINTITDPAKKTATIQEMDLAKRTVATGDSAACGVHTNKIEAMGK